jgi:hypothetical protein
MTKPANEEPPRFDADTLHLVRDLFARATLRLADAHEIAVEGQSHKKSQRQYRALAASLKTEADAIAVLATAISVVMTERAVIRNRAAKPKPTRAKD